ncbi:prepilin-type N-terminal cleavage/methylation domain-containing protein [Stenotrophomonas maltophilia]|uniref:pilin n=1 Tax=Stenotrophomonas hibiscicola TaxID=86189 RepID=UPI00131F9D19|nr:prepilin-type N-terminal cleavage/methylation domain-containing protein [Stenotrophomonas maltophilia]MBA0470847.1 prepilin-type N-terminal cleavage/methylation domain-containing protein [Stenotrophomonas maltophilia]MBA0477240.1 prepilin-type N-terminal cleavage/methylation domain-containing protein [Stenotrophomonas maltophilia]MBA0485786.1 prepilin-type N-terminal cleavage/methylation domain-containing protein [Stenotrophomonas maltophilia]MCU1052201.1 pilin [Stenotrophomonas maltophilia]
MKNQKGFTLIELMIVVAIIAILAAIAIPQYNDYTARAQMTEAFTLASGMKTPIAEAFAQDNTAANSCVVPAGSVTTGKYVASLTPTPGADSCAIEAKMKAAGVNEKVKEATVTLTYKPSTGAWTCKSSVSAAITPKACDPT